MKNILKLEIYIVLKSELQIDVAVYLPFASLRHFHLHSRTLFYVTELLRTEGP